MVKLAAALFEPDKSRYDMAASSNIMNALPVADGWAPMPSLSDKNPLIRVLEDEDGTPLTDESGNVLVELISGTFGPGDALALPEQSRGGIFVRLQNGSTRLFIGTETRLWEFDQSGYFFKDVSGASAPYACDDRWSFALYGTTLYCCDGADPEQMFDIGTDTVFSDNTSAPVATDIIVIDDFMMRALPDNSVQWSSLDDPQSNTVGLDFSDVQPFGDGNGIQRILPLSGGALVIQRDKIEVLNFPDPTFTFRRSQLNGYRGSPAKWSAQVIGQDDFVVYCIDGFFRGTNFQAIGAEKVDRFILDNCDETARQNMISAPDFKRKIVWFRVQKTDGSYLLLGYNWQLDRWTQSNADMADMFRLETVGLTIGALPSVFPTIADLADITFGSSIFDGGATEFGGVTSDGYLAYLYGPAMEAILETNEAALNETSRAFVNGGRLDGDAANFTAVLATADYKGQPFRARNAVTPSARTRFIPFRGDGRVQKVTATIPAGEPWTIFQGVDLDVVGSAKS
jgi:hypothetical protein